MKICKRGLNSIYIRNVDADVVACAWMDDQYLGNLHEQSLYDIYHGERAEKLRARLFAGDYSKCWSEHCPFCRKDTTNEMLIDVDEVPEWPEELWLSYENTCNYNCPSCTVHCMMENNKERDLEKEYAFIEEQIRPLLPHLKFISANGLGEVFSSKSIMKILSEWKPIAPAEEITVLIETNGSLFNENNFKKIENLGQYNLKVSLTVMSFDEYTYQVLSGTKLPISNIENNLRYVKSLREKGIINHLELCTVVQERNFRTLPELTRRFIEEFGADEVRLRPYTPWGRFDTAMEWFSTINNHYHPYYSEYVEVMKHPIFKHPKVNDWSGGIESGLGEHPYLKDLKREKKKTELLMKMNVDRNLLEKNIKNKVGNSKVAIYGLGPVGKNLLEIIKNTNDIEYIIDNFYNECTYENYNVVDVKNIPSIEDVKIIVCILDDDKNILEGLSEQGVDIDNCFFIDKMF